MRAARFLEGMAHAIALPVAIALGACGGDAGGSAAGWRSVSTSAPSGTLLIGSPPATGSATEALRATLGEMARRLDGPVTPLAAYRDRDDRMAQAVFAAQDRGEPMSGVVVSATAFAPGFLAVAYDRTDRLPRSRDALLAALAEHLPTGPTEGRPGVRWQTVPLPDGSGSIRIPEGWRVTSAHQGAVDVAGPGGEAMSLGIGYPVATPEAATNPVTGQLLDGLVSPPLDPVTAVRSLFPRVAELLQRTNPTQPLLSAVRILEVAALQSSVGGQAAFVLWEARVGGRPYRAFSLVDCSPPASGYWMLYNSTLAAPAETFADAFPIMMEAWGGWRVDPAVFRRRLQQAYRTMQETHRLLSQTHEARNRALESSLADWTEAFRGTRVVEDRETGERRDFDIGWVDEQVEFLNERAGYERFRQIPLRELGR